MQFQRSKKKIFSISMVKNEEDIIESFIRYHLNIFDGMVILDNFSSDNTLTIMQQLREEGLPVYIIQDTSMEWTPDQKLNQILYKTFQYFKPDSVFPLDADEFLISSHYMVHPRSIIDAIEDENQILSIDRVRYVPDLSDHQYELFIPRKITHVCTDPYNISPKVIVTRGIVTRYQPSLTVGNHSFKFNSKVSIKKKLVEDLKIAHFPVRSINQLKSKIIIGGINVLTRPNRKPRESVHRLELLKKIKEHPDITYHEFIQIAKEYSVRNLSPDITITTEYQPMNLAFCKHISLKYTKPTQRSVLKDLIENSEQLANDYAKLKMEWMKMMGLEYQ